MKNTLGDLNNYLFEQLERINDDELEGEELNQQIRKTDTIVKISSQIINNATLQFQAMKHMDEYGADHDRKAPKVLMIEEDHE